jgi:protein O-mannosyl-transferase
LVRRAALTRSGRRPSPWLGPLVFLAAGAAFLPALRNGFVWDDWALIVRTVGFRGFDARHLRWMATTTHMANYTPLAWLSYGFDYALWGLEPAGYHLTNLLLHAANAALFFLLARLLLASIFPSERGAKGELGAAFAALAFALSPLRVESVAWASERRDVLAGFFALSALYLYCRAAASRDEREHAGLRLLSLGAYLCAALSKPTVVPLPAALLALDYYPLRRLGAGEKTGYRNAVLREKIPYVLLALFAAAMAVRAQAASGNLTAVASYGLASRLAQAVCGLGFYVGRTLIPAGLSALYPLPENAAAFARPLALSLAALAAALLALRAARVERKAAAALWIYYAAMLLPVLGLVQNGRQFVALRYSYLSCLGWALLGGAGVVAALRLREKRPFLGGAVLAAAGLWLGANAWAEQRQIALWRDDGTLWTDVIRQYRRSTGDEAGFVAVAETLAGQGRLADAQAALELGLRDAPGAKDAEALLGFVLARQGNDDDALPHLLLAARAKPESAEAQANAGSALARLGRFAEALPYFESAAALEPGSPDRAAVLAQVRADLARSARARR